MVDLTRALRRHTHLGFDTPVFIYHLESVPPFAAPADVALQVLRSDLATGVTSVVTLTELLVKPLQAGRRGLAARYEALVRAIPNLSLVDIDARIARRAATLRATYPLRSADALQIAACIERGATAFVTNDSRLRRIAEIDVLILGDYVQP